nr:helix-turn-helix transcriptional regulator [uncultured Gellertiella sp.]
MPVADPNDRNTPPGWTAALATAILTLGSDAFPQALRQLLDQLVASDGIIVTAYRGLERPQALYHDLPPDSALMATLTYESGPYLIDPFFLAVRNGVSPGAYRIGDVAPKGFHRSPYFETYYRRTLAVDELCLLLEPEGESWLTLSLGRGPEDRPFSGTERDRVRSQFPVLSALVHHHFGGGRITQMGEAGSSPASQEAEMLKGLSPRERDIIRLILDGRSTRGIAAMLGLAEGTVKVHRRHAYAKLDVATRGELFARVMKRV